LITEKLIINYSPLSPEWGVSDASLFLKGVGRIKAPYQGDGGIKITPDKGGFLLV
jgi:hypothetical protein